MEQVRLPLLNRLGAEEVDGDKSVDLESLTSPAWRSTNTPQQWTPNFYTPRLLCLQIFCCLIGITLLTSTIQYFYFYSSTIPLFIGLAFIFVSWHVLRWYSIIAFLGTIHPVTMWRTKSVPGRGRLAMRLCFLASTLFAIWIVYLAVLPIPHLDAPTLRLSGDRYFIAINFYNNEEIMADYTRELSALVDHLGRENVYVSIYESNSVDETPVMLRDFGRTLYHHRVDHRIISVTNDGRQPFGLSSMERIAYLAKTRNKALEPLQSPDPSIRVPEWQTFTKIIFMNDIVYRWRDIARLIGTKLDGREDEEYDMVCALDFEGSGSYDTWVGRDICGAWFISTWPYVKDHQSVQAVRDYKPFEVATCWHGAVVLKAQPFLYSSDVSAPLEADATNHGGLSAHHQTLKRWQMIDNSSYPESRFSPDLETPLRFRTSAIKECVHSECFLLAYDLHRMYRDVEGSPKIWMNPSVQVAYNWNEYNWNNVILRIPVIKWWRDIWSHRIGWYLVRAWTEIKERRVDACTWSGLKTPTEHGRCPPLPGAPIPKGPNDV